MFALSYREQLAALSRSLLDELDQIVASAQARWFPQHKADGTHGAVTATSVTAPQVTLTQTDGTSYTLYVSGGTLYIVAGTTPSGGTVVGTQT